MQNDSIKDGSFLVITRHNNAEVFLILRSDKPIWNLPGGGIEDNETPLQAAIRETNEETGFEVGNLEYIGNYQNINIHTDTIWNRTYLYITSHYKGIFTPEFEGCEGKWFPVDSLPKNIQQITATRVKDAIERVPFKDRLFRQTTSVKN